VALGGIIELELFCFVDLHLWLELAFLGQVKCLVVGWSDLIEVVSGLSSFEPQ
jgi:hypothetical protein